MCETHESLDPRVVFYNELLSHENYKLIYILTQSTSTTKKTHISCQFCFEFFFVENTYKFCCEKKFARNYYHFFLQNILYKTLFATKFVGNTYKFYNFVENNYPRRNYLQIKILEKMTEKSLFLQMFLTNLQEKSHVI